MIKLTAIEGCILLCAVPLPVEDVTTPVAVATVTAPAAAPEYAVAPVAVWVWAASSAMDKAWVSVPVFAAMVRAVSPEPVPIPIGVLPNKSGKLNVVDPSPTPHVVLIAVNSTE